MCACVQVFVFFLLNDIDDSIRGFNIIFFGTTRQIFILIVQVIGSHFLRIAKLRYENKSKMRKKSNKIAGKISYTHISISET